MGMFLGDDDGYIGGLLETLNLHFGDFEDVPDSGADKLHPNEKNMRLHASGIREMQAIQAEFQVFKPGRPLVQSMQALGVAGRLNTSVKRKWFRLLSWLDRVPSSDPKVSGGEAIVARLVQHLQPGNPDLDPVHFKAHDARQQQQVLITPKDRPVFYLERDFLTISIPMAPRPPKTGH
jgi:hypothetical protein